MSDWIENSFFFFSIVDNGFVYASWRRIADMNVIYFVIASIYFQIILIFFLLKLAY